MANIHMNLYVGGPLRAYLVRALTGILLLWFTSPVHAHLMVAQRGTLNLQGNGAFMVLSAPASAFPGADDSGDGKLSQAELAAHQKEMEATVAQNVLLHDRLEQRPLQGIFFTLTPPEDAPQAPADQLVVMARFALVEPVETSHQSLRFTVRLFGRTAQERTFQVMATQGTQAQLMVLTPEHSERAVFPSALSTFLDYVDTGASHILTGMDHLLFLMVVLVASTRWRHIVLALTCFTVGHSVTLVASLWGGFSLPDAVVEPAIAATIVGMAIFDEWLRRKALTPPLPLRLGLVFLCSLIHGLGLASSLTELGLDSSNRILSLAGFNVGIELGQLAVAGLALGLYQFVKKQAGTRGRDLLLRLTSVVAGGAGSVWLVTRLLG